MIYVGDNQKGASDREILRSAIGERRIIITNDKDFGDLVFRQNWHHYGIILLRLRKDSPKARIKVLKELIGKHSDKPPGHFSVVSENGVRVRRTR